MPNNIRRYERKRVVTVSAYVNTAYNSVNHIQQDLTSRYLNELIAQYPSMNWSAAGKQNFGGTHPLSTVGGGNIMSAAGENCFGATHPLSTVGGNISSAAGEFVFGTVVRS